MDTVTSILMTILEVYRAVEHGGPWMWLIVLAGGLALNLFAAELSDQIGYNIDDILKLGGSVMVFMGAIAGVNHFLYG